MFRIDVHVLSYRHSVLRLSMQRFAAVSLSPLCFRQIRNPQIPDRKMTIEEWYHSNHKNEENAPSPPTTLCKMMICRKNAST